VRSENMVVEFHLVEFGIGYLVGSILIGIWFWWQSR